MTTVYVEALLSTFPIVLPQGTHSTLRDALDQVFSVINTLGAGVTSVWFVRILDGTPVLPSGLWSAPTGAHRVIVLGELPMTSAVNPGRATVSSGLAAPTLFAGAGLRVDLVRLDVRAVPLGAGAALPLLAVRDGARLVVDSSSLEFVGPGVAGRPAAIAAYGGAGAGRGSLDVNNCTITGWGKGVYAAEAEFVVVTDSALVGMRVGVDVSRAATVRIQNTVFVDCATGLAQRSRRDNELLVEDSRFEECSTGIALDVTTAPRSTSLVRRTEFRAPSEWDWTEGRWLPTSRTSAVGITVDGPGSLSTGTGEGIAETRPTVRIESGIFHLLHTGVEVQPSPNAHIHVDQDTFAECAWAGVMVEGGEAAWRSSYWLIFERARSRVPGLIVSNSLFIGRDRWAEFPFVGVGLGDWAPGSFSVDPFAAPERLFLLIAANMFWGFGTPGQSPVVTRVASIRRTLLPPMLLTEDRFGPGNHWHLGTPFANSTAPDPMLARAARLTPGGAFDFDYHPVKSLGSPLVDRSLDFWLQMPGILVSEVDVLALWRYLPRGTAGFYGNESVVLDLVAPPRQAVGAAEPAGWVEYPIYAQQVSPEPSEAWKVSLELGQAVDVISYSSHFGVAAADVLTQLSGDAVSDAPTLFHLDTLRDVGELALAVGLKVVHELKMRGTGSILLPNADGAVGASPYVLPSGYPVLELDQALSDRFLAFWRQAAVASCEAIRQDPFLNYLVPWWWMPEETRADARLGSATQAGGGGAPWEYGACMLLRRDIEALGPPFKPIYTFQASSSDYGTGLPAHLAGAASYGVPPSAARRDVGGIFYFDPMGDVVTWVDRFNNGAVVGDTPVSVGRPDPAAGGAALADVPPPDETAQTQVGYHNTRLDGVVVAPPLSPAVDALGFWFAHLDGLFPGNYVDPDLSGSPPPGEEEPDEEEPADDLPRPPRVDENRIRALHRLRSIVEARANAEFMLGPYSQALHDGAVHHMLFNYANDEGRVGPETASFAAHDLLIGLADADGIGLYSIAKRWLVYRESGWYGFSGAYLSDGNNDGSVPHPGWTGYEAVLKLIKTELREFLVCGERDFDLGFQVTFPEVANLQVLPSSDYGALSGWVGIAGYPRLGHTILRIRDRVLLLVTHSATDVTTTFEFCDATRFPNASAVQLLTIDGVSMAVSLSGGSHRFSADLSGIQARVYRIDLT